LNNPDKTKAIERRHYENKKKKPKTPKQKIDSNMGNALCIALKGKKQYRRWEVLVGYTVNELINHLEKQFDGKMS
jgi:hypothetical protein